MISFEEYCNKKGFTLDAIVKEMIGQGSSPRRLIEAAVKNSAASLRFIYLINFDISYLFNKENWGTINSEWSQMVSRHGGADFFRNKESALDFEQKYMTARGFAILPECMPKTGYVSKIKRRGLKNSFDEVGSFNKDKLCSDI